MNGGVFAGPVDVCRSDEPHETAGAVSGPDPRTVSGLWVPVRALKGLESWAPWWCTGVGDLAPVVTPPNESPGLRPWALGEALFGALCSITGQWCDPGPGQPETARAHSLPPGTEPAPYYVCPAGWARVVCSSPPSLGCGCGRLGGCSVSVPHGCWCLQVGQWAPPGLGALRASQHHTSHAR
jgi:hypothetical protein